jgi:phosphoribosylglycinamide formyltransferase 1
LIVAPREPPISDPPIRLAVCASGGGTTLQNLIDRIADRRLSASIEVVVASRAGIGAIVKAEAAGIQVALIERKGRSVEGFSLGVFKAIRQAQVDLVILGGFLCLLDIPGDYEGRIINIHPSLLPSFGGKGFHGEAVHRAVLDAGSKVSGCTVHFVDDTYDTGPIISQHVVPVLDEDSPATLAARVFAAECRALPDAIALYADGRLRVEGRRVHILDPIRE